MGAQSDPRYGTFMQDTTRSRGKSKIQDIEAKLDQLTTVVKDIASRSPDVSLDRRAPMQNPSLGVSNSNRMDPRDPFLNTRSNFFTASQNQDKLTHNVWPKNRILLAIASRMHKEKFIDLEERGTLKDMIIAKDTRLHDILSDYYIDCDKNNLYRNIKMLISFNR